MTDTEKTLHEKIKHSLEVELPLMMSNFGGYFTMPEVNVADWDDKTRIEVRYDNEGAFIITEMFAPKFKDISVFNEWMNSDECGVVSTRIRDILEGLVAEEHMANIVDRFPAFQRFPIAEKILHFEFNIEISYDGEEYSLSLSPHGVFVPEAISNDILGDEETLNLVDDEETGYYFSYDVFNRRFNELLEERVTYKPQ